MHFRILLYPGFDELDAIGPFEVLAMAARRLGSPPEADGSIRTPWIVELRAIGDAQAVRASNGLRVLVDRDPGTIAPLADDVPVESLPAPDVLVVPGGGWVDRSREGARTEYERGDGPGTVAAAARAAHERGAVVASVCTGAMLLARAGLLRGRRCITHHAAIEDLQAHGAVIVRERVVDDGDIVTAGGVTSGIDLALHLVERFADSALADGITATLEHARARAIVRT